MWYSYVVFSILFSVKVIFLSVISILLQTGFENVRACSFFSFGKILKGFFFCRQKSSDLACLKFAITFPMIQWLACLKCAIIFGRNILWSNDECDTLIMSCSVFWLVWECQHYFNKPWVENVGACFFFLQRYWKVFFLTEIKWLIMFVMCNYIWYDPKMSVIHTLVMMCSLICLVWIWKYWDMLEIDI